MLVPPTLMPWLQEMIRLLITKIRKVQCIIFKLLPVTLLLQHLQVLNLSIYCGTISYGNQLLIRISIYQVRKTIQFVRNWRQQEVPTMLHLKNVQQFWSDLVNIFFNKVRTTSIDVYKPERHHCNCLINTFAMCWSHGIFTFFSCIFYASTSLESCYYPSNIRYSSI